MEEMQGDH
jgi:hypothetical protein